MVKKSFSSRRGQMMAEPFKYIMAIVIIAMIVTFGTYLIMKLMGTKDSVEIAKFKIDLKNQVTEVYQLSPGSTKTVTFSNIPTGIKAICFIDIPRISGKTDYEDIDGLTDLYKQESVNLDRNVFFSMMSNSYNALDPLVIPKIMPAVNPLCFDTATKSLKVVFENKGKTVEVRAPKK